MKVACTLLQILFKIFTLKFEDVPKILLVFRFKALISLRFFKIFNYRTACVVWGLEALFDSSCGLLVRSGDGCWDGWICARCGCWCWCYYSTDPATAAHRMAWWQPTLLIHVAWVWRIRDEKQGNDYGYDFSRLFWFTHTGCPAETWMLSL